MFSISEKQYKLLHQIFKKSEILHCIDHANKLPSNQFEAFVQSILECFVRKNMIHNPDLDFNDETNLTIERLIKIFSTFASTTTIFSDEYIYNSISELHEHISEEPEEESEEESKEVDVITIFENLLKLSNTNLNSISPSDLASQKAYVLDIKNNLVNHFDYTFSSNLMKSYEQEINVIALIDNLNKFFKEYKEYAADASIINQSQANLIMIRKNYFNHLYLSEQNRYKNYSKRLVSTAGIKIDPISPILDETRSTSARKNTRK